MAPWLGSEHDYQVEIGRAGQEQPSGNPDQAAIQRTLLNLIQNSRILLMHLLERNFFRSV